MSLYVIGFSFSSKDRSNRGGSMNSYMMLLFLIILVDAQRIQTAGKVILEETAIVASRQADITKDNNSTAQQENYVVMTGVSCGCPDKLNYYILKSLKQCVVTFRDIVVYSMSSFAVSFSNLHIYAVCSCRDQVTEDLLKSLKACTRALEILVNCKSKLPSSCREVVKENPKSQSGYYTLLVNYKKLLIYCFMGNLC